MNLEENPIYQASIILLEHARQNKPLALEFAKNCPDKSFLKEWCTIRVASARRSGHSVAIAELTHLFKCPVVIFFNQHQAKILKEYTTMNPNTISITMRKLHKLGKILEKNPVDCIFIDIASLWSSTRIDTLYLIAQSLAKNPEFFIMMFE